MERIARRKPALEVAELTLVLALAEAGSTVRASAALHLDKSAVSSGLLAVEDTLGTRLFDRKARGLTLTQAGRRLVVGAGPVLAQLLEREENVRTVTAGCVPLRGVSECARQPAIRRV